MLVCISPNGGAQYSGTAPLRSIRVATVEGIASFNRDAPGAPWRRGDQLRPDLHVSALLFDPRSGLLFAGGHGSGGLWRSADDGKTWHRLTNGLTNQHIYSVQAQYIGDKTRLWVGAEPTSLYLSDDLGTTWTERDSLRRVPEHENWTFPSPPHIGHVKGVAWHNAKPNRIFVLVEQGGLYVSQDAGLTWRELKGYLIGDQKFYRDAHRICIRPSDPDQIYFATGDGLCRSEDGGETWNYLMTKEGRIGYPDAMFIDAHDERKIVIGGPKLGPELWSKIFHSQATVLVSPDGGATWIEKANGLNAPLKGNIEAMSMYSTATSVDYLAGTATGQLFLSEDGCESWACLADDLPPISKAGHFRWFLSEEERHAVEERMRRWSGAAA